MNFVRRIFNKLNREYASVAGPKRNCNVCGNSFDRKFYPLPNMYLEKAKETGFPYLANESETMNYKEYACHFCHCTDRDRLYALYLDFQLVNSRKYKLLDIAPGEALRKKLLSSPNIEYRSADLFRADVDDKVDLMDMNIYADNSFDIFICSHVLEHVLDDIKAMKELRRVLKPDGFGILMAPIILSLKNIDEDVTIKDPNERWKRFGQEDHVRLYSKSGYLNRLEQAGLKVKEVTVDNFSKNEFILHGISLKSVLYIVTK